MSLEESIGRIRQTLNDVHATLELYFELPADLRAYQLNAESWTIDEILEHITLTSHFLLIVIRQGRDKALKRSAKISASEYLQPSEIDLDAIALIGHPDAFSWIRPEHMEPTRTKSSDDIRAVMDRQFRECLDILDQLPKGIGTLHKVRMSVRDLGKLDMYQWLYFLAQHAKRHAVEIERIIQRYSAEKELGK